MNVKLPKNLIIFCFIFFIVAGLSVKVSAQEENSILNRIQTIEDPELGELISIALENFNSPELEELKIYESSNLINFEYTKLKNLVQTQKLQIVRKVTEAYSEIKLLDSQIEQIEKRLYFSKSLETLASELFLAKTELETKLTNKLAELRETMNIIPIHPFGRRPVEQINAWIKLEVIGEQVVVFNCSKPFNNNYYLMEHNFIKLMSHNEAFDYITNNLKTLPVRIDILRNIEGIKLSEELNKQIIDFIKDKNLEMQAEVYLNQIRTQQFATGLLIQDGKVGTSITGASKTTKVLSGLLDPNQVDDYIHRYSIGLPERLPQVFNLRYDEESKDLALDIEKNINNFAQKNGIEKLITVKMEIYNFKNNQ